MLSKIPMGRLGQVDEVAALVVLARLRGVLVLDRRRVRHLRRPRDVLTMSRVADELATSIETLP